MSQRTQHSTTLQFARLHDTYTHADITVAVHQDSSWSVSVFASMLHCTLMIFGVAHQCSWAGEVRQSEKVFLSLPTFQSRVEMANMHYSVQPGALPSSQYSIYCPQNQSVTCIPFNQGCHWNMHVRNASIVTASLANYMTYKELLMCATVSALLECAKCSVVRI